MEITIVTARGKRIVAPWRLTKDKRQESPKKWYMMKAMNSQQPVLIPWVLSVTASVMALFLAREIRSCSFDRSGLFTILLPQPKVLPFKIWDH